MAASKTTNKVANPVTIQAPVNPPVSQQVTAQQPVSPIVTPQGQVFLPPVSQSHTTLGKGFDSSMVEDTIENNGRKGRAKGTGMIVDLVKNITAIKETPSLHGKAIRVGQWASAQSATTMRQKLRKEYLALVKDMEILIGGATVTDANGNQVEGSKMLVKYGIPRAENQG